MNFPQFLSSPWQRWQQKQKANTNFNFPQVLSSPSFYRSIFQFIRTYAHMVSPPLSLSSCFFLCTFSLSFSFLRFLKLFFENNFPQKFTGFFFIFGSVSSVFVSDLLFSHLGVFPFCCFAFDSLRSFEALIFISY